MDENSQSPMTWAQFNLASKVRSKLGRQVRWLRLGNLPEEVIATCLIEREGTVVEEEKVYRLDEKGDLVACQATSPSP